MEQQNGRLNLGAPLNALDQALMLARAGLPVFPCHVSKAPACPGGFTAAATREGAVRDWWGRYPGRLIGVATGAASGIDVLDLDLKQDGKPDGAAWWTAHEADIPATFAYLTRSGGLHLWFQHAEGMRNSAGRIAPGVDVRADGGFVIYWPAAGHDVLRFEPPAPLPATLLAALDRPPAGRVAVSAPVFPSGEARRGYALAAVRSGVQRVATAPQGSRNDALNRECFALARFTATGALTPSEVAHAMAVAGRGAGLSDHEITRTIASALRARMAA